MMLDDNSGILGSSATGIAGEVVRAVGRGFSNEPALADLDHVWALSVEEITQLLDGGASANPDDAASPRAAWAALNHLDPPLHLNGEPAPPPDADLFPAPVARLMSAIGRVPGRQVQRCTGNDRHRCTIGDRPRRCRAECERRSRPASAR